MPLPSRRNRPASEPAVADVARRRLAGLRAQLAAERGEDVESTTHGGDGPGTPAPGGLTLGHGRPAPSPESAPPPGRHARRPVGPLRRCGDWCADRMPAVL